LRRQLIVKEHGNLLYPEGTACADVLIAGDKGGSFAGRVFAGLGLGALYTFFQNENMFKVWPSTPTYTPSWYPGSSLRANTTSEYLGVGYIIGPRIAGVIFAGGVFAWLVVMPAIKFFGSHVPGAIFPGTMPIANMGPDDIYRAYIRPMGAGAVAAAGLITLLRTIPTIIGALRAGAKDLAKGASAAASNLRRTDKDISLKWALLGAAILLVIMWAMLTFFPIKNAETHGLNNFFAALLVVVFGFLFVTVSSRITGLIGSSSNPISGMAIATLMATCAMFLVMGWTATAFSALAITIGGVVCIASANAGNTSQDLKTGFLVGATPAKQQMALMVGVTVSVVAIGMTLGLMNAALESFRPANITIADIHNPPVGVSEYSGKFDRQTVPVAATAGGPTTDQSVKGMKLYTAINSPTVPNGYYFYNPQSQKFEVQWIQGIGSDSASAPQAQLMATVINGILARRLPWGLILLGVFLVIAVELLGIRSLSFAVGFYLSIATTLAIFAGGVVRWLVESRGRRGGQASQESEVSPGSLYSSGLIAAGGIVGLLGMFIKVAEGWHWLPENAIAWGPKLHFIADHADFGNILAVIMFGLLAYSLYHYAGKPLDDKK
jgi:uncharacterized oligopeptide transporter (OPT) family protein